ncbi:MFS transporter, partial [Bacillus cereus group sp. MG20]
MTTNTHINLKKNTISYLSSNFFWNLGRTIPHAILTILLIDLGLSLEKIAFLQIVYMIAVMLLEFPSGIMSDYWSRKGMFIISIILILISYFIIYVSEGNFYLLMISWFLYGTSTAAKSGSLESELVNQINKENKSIKKFSVWDSYLLSISSSIGAIIGSLFYERIHQNIYLISFILFFLSIIFSSIFSIKKEKVQTKKIKKKPFSFKDIKKDILYFSRNSVLTEIIILFTLLSLFLQPFFQYWQVLYENKHISITYFGYVYFIFQICNIIGTYLFETITYKRNISYIILGIISISSLITLTFLEGITFFIAFPIILCTY